MKPLVAIMATATVALAATDATFAATLVVEPADRCYREQQRVAFKAEGFTPNGWVQFTRGSKFREHAQADPSGAISGYLFLPGLEAPRRRLTYLATDQTNPAITAEVTLLATATDVTLTPERGRPNRVLTIRGRGFAVGRTLYAHVVRRDRPPSTARRVRIGRLKGPCGVVSARRRLFRGAVAPGEYRVQFDTFRRYRKGRKVRSEYVVTILPPGQSSPRGRDRNDRNRRGDQNGRGDQNHRGDRHRRGDRGDRNG
jgi:hypothetical protein